MMRLNRNWPNQLARQKIAMTPRSCPHCHVVIPVDRGFYFDDKLNLICGECNKIAFPTVEETDKLNQFPRQNNSPAYQPYQPLPKFGKVIDEAEG